VLRARLADASSSTTRTAARRSRARAAPRSVVYHNKLGTQAERVERLRFLARHRAARRRRRGARRARGAAREGGSRHRHGRRVPRAAGHDGPLLRAARRRARRVADAIAQHYWPRFAGDALPERPVAQAVALADKLESLAGMFGIGSVPTGDKDPFGLRRAALGVLRILVERALAARCARSSAHAFEAFTRARRSPRRRRAARFPVRAPARHLRDQGYTAQQVAPWSTRGRTSSPTCRSGSPPCARSRRCPKPQALAARTSAPSTSCARRRRPRRRPPSTRALLAPAPSAPARRARAPRARSSTRIAPRRLHGALVACARARDAVDRFFDDVMVMADDPRLRANRLALLRGVRATMNRVADIALLRAYPACSLPTASGVRRDRRPARRAEAPASP
jgi:glycyl-tRNA synthetase beta chain